MGHFNWAAYSLKGIEPGRTKRRGRFARTLSKTASLPAAPRSWRTASFQPRLRLMMPATAMARWPAAVPSSTASIGEEILTPLSTTRTGTRLRATIDRHVAPGLRRDAGAFDPPGDSRQRSNRAREGKACRNKQSHVLDEDARHLGVERSCQFQHDLHRREAVARNIQRQENAPRCGVGFSHCSPSRARLGPARFVS